ncbi:MAG: AAA family ATPase [Anaerolineales bacterium]|nr:AAA family ATPase [Anaerolineales bacterium]
MIKKILEIKNLGIFRDYRWDSAMPEFGRFNLVYGWNGSGKTTLSELFSAFEYGSLDEYPDFKYKIDTTDGEHTEGSSYNKKVRVFNQKYVSQNIDILSCKANPIYILGEENKKLADQIKKDELILKGNPETGDLGKLKELDVKKKELKQKEEIKAEHFSSVAKIISTNISGVSARNYRRNNAEKDYELLKSKRLLSNQEIEKHLATLKQQEMEILDEIISPVIEEDVEKIIENARELLKQTVEVVVIERLQQHPHISQWVEDGFLLHQQEDSKKCEYCGQTLPESRILALASYFNAADKKLKESIDSLIKRLEKLQKAIQEVKIREKSNLYNEYQDEYSLKAIELENTKQNLLNEIVNFKEEISSKKLQTTISLKLNKTIDVGMYIKLIGDLNACINHHNEKSKNFLKERKEAEENLKDHYLSEKYDAIQPLKADISKLEGEINALENGNPDDSNDIGIKKIQQRIDENKNKISVSGLACDEINKNLETFLGRKELVLEDSEDGYILKRNGEIAKNLSEGEKTAIAFVYFTIHLKDRDFDLGNDIVVIDDPISSLDSNSLFQAFSFLKNTVQDCAQVFILTHNYDFLQLIINWFHGMPKKHGSKAYYMIKNIRSEGKRAAKLDVLDKLLISYNSEYQYLFKTLLEFSPDGTIDSVYHIPNIARKVLDSFLMIMVPDNRNPYQKLEQINFDKNKKTAIYKFTNDQSHITGKGFDPSLVSESQNVITYLLEMMQTVFPSHYEVLENSVRTSEPPTTG